MSGAKIIQGLKEAAEVAPYAMRIFDLERENARLRIALEWIADQEPATQEMTALHAVCQHARETLTNPPAD